LAADHTRREQYFLFGRPDPYPRLCHEVRPHLSQDRCQCRERCNVDASAEARTQLDQPLRHYRCGALDESYGVSAGVAVLGAQQQIVLNRLASVGINRQGHDVSRHLLERAQGAAYPGDKRVLARIKGVGWLQHHAGIAAGLAFDQCQRGGERNRRSATRLVDDAPVVRYPPRWIAPHLR